MSGRTPYSDFLLKNDAFFQRRRKYSTLSYNREKYIPPPHSCIWEEARTEQIPDNFRSRNFRTSAHFLAESPLTWWAQMPKAVRSKIFRRHRGDAPRSLCFPRFPACT